jgi:hypothetical protein
MRLKEIQTDAKLVIVFKGMHGDDYSGNQQCIALAERLNASIFEYTQAGAALALIAQRRPKTLVLIGYSAGVKTVIAVGRQTDPTLSIFIAGYPITLLQSERTVNGAYVNYYQQRELDDILASKGMPPYKPQGGQAHEINVKHADIVAAVTPAVVAQVNRLVGNGDLEVSAKPVATPTSRINADRYKK